MQTLLSVSGVSLRKLQFPYCFVGMSASPAAAAATAAVATEPEKDFSSSAPAARTAGVWVGRSPSVLGEERLWLNGSFGVLAYHLSISLGSFLNGC